MQESDVTSANMRNIPKYMHVAIKGYVLEGRHIGDFLYALLSNDFMRAANHAYDSNIQCLGDYAHFLYNYTPGACYGSEQKVNAWQDIGGLRGYLKQQEDKANGNGN